MHRFRVFRLVLPAVLGALAIVAGCGRSGRPREPSSTFRVEVWSDTSTSAPFRVEPPRAARIWMRSVAIARPAAVEAPLPSADPEILPPDTIAPPALEIDPGLKPPILRVPARLALPPSLARGSGARAFAVELDVRVSEAGEVTDARWAGGSADTALVAAATACARAMLYFPALRGGRPVSVWCRQRFEFPAR